MKTESKYLRLSASIGGSTLFTLDGHKKTGHARSNRAGVALEKIPSRYTVWRPTNVKRIEINCVVDLAEA